jgi:hypothetical protein
VSAFRDEFLANIAKALNVPFHLICVGQFPVIKGSTMSKFKFPLGAAVVLLTSFTDACAEKTESDKEVREGAERAAAAARNSHLAENGRSDLIQSRRTMSASPKEWSVGSLTAMRAPIEAGDVIGRVEYISDENRYLVRYRGGDGKQVEEFIPESALRLDPRMNPSPFASEGAGKDPTPEQIRSDD